MSKQKNERPLGSREKVIVAAAELLGEDPGAQLSVRAVAARAGVSTGSLRYHFPTQRELRETVLTTIYDVVTAGDDVIHDSARPARDRLVECLRQVVAPLGIGAQAREAWGKTFETFVLRVPTAKQRESYLAMEREGARRIEYWLTVLIKEGAMVAGDTTRRVRFLNTVLTGLSIDRALPAEDSILEAETQTLYAAVDWVLQST